MHDRTIHTESISRRNWKRDVEPTTICLIRFHAIGDVAITMPTCHALRKRYPHARIDFLTSDLTEAIPTATTIFDQVFAIHLPADKIRRAQLAIQTGINFRNHRYDIIFDLQRNWFSRMIRRIARPDAWSEFERSAPIPAATRVMETLERIGIRQLELNYERLRNPPLMERAKNRLLQEGWNGDQPIVVLNPAGYWHSRNWSATNYFQLANLWMQDEDVRFLFLGTERLTERAANFQSRFPEATINLVGRTSLSEAYAILQSASIVVSEDSGLMHLAWISGIPTIALFGSSRHQWSSPQGPHTHTFHSGDLPCASCMQPYCKYGDVHCLNRITPTEVFLAAQEVRKQFCSLQSR